MLYSLETCPLTIHHPHTPAEIAEMLRLAKHLGSDLGNDFCLNHCNPAFRAAFRAHFGCDPLMNDLDDFIFHVALLEHTLDGDPIAYERAVTRMVAAYERAEQEAADELWMTVDELRHRHWGDDEGFQANGRRAFALLRMGVCLADLKAECSARYAGAWEDLTTFQLVDFA